jgi:hypothetical protein
MAKPITGMSWTRLPSELRPFIEFPELSQLAEILRTHPGLYWHPLVVRQVLYLGRLRHDEGEWKRLGWRRKHDDMDGVELPPTQVAAVVHAMVQLLEAHALGLVRHKRIVWKARRQPGRKRGVKNPHPSDPWTIVVDPAWLHEDFVDLRERFKVKLSQRRDKPTFRAAAKEWYRGLAQEVLQEATEHGAVGWWSNWKTYGLASTESFEYSIEQWKPLDMTSVIERTSAETKPKSLRREGQPAYLAYAVLGALLDQTPDAVMTLLNNHRYPRRRK